MLCSVPDGSTFKIQVKGISNQNALYIDKSFFDAPGQENLFLVVVLVPKDVALPFRFFVLSHAQAKTESAKLPTRKRDGQPFVVEGGLNWGSFKSYENAWATFPPIGEGEHFAQKRFPALGPSEDTNGR